MLSINRKSKRQYTKVHYHCRFPTSLLDRISFEWKSLTLFSFPNQRVRQIQVKCLSKLRRQGKLVDFSLFQREPDLLGLLTNGNFHKGLSTNIRTDCQPILLHNIFFKKKKGPQTSVSTDFIFTLNTLKALKGIYLPLQVFFTLYKYNNRNKNKLFQKGPRD